MRRASARASRREVAFDALKVRPRRDARLALLDAEVRVSQTEGGRDGGRTASDGLFSAGKVLSILSPSRWFRARLKARLALLPMTEVNNCRDFLRHVRRQRSRTTGQPSSGSAKPAVSGDDGVAAARTR